jgi:hypothetical protein
VEDQKKIQEKKVWGETERQGERKKNRERQGSQKKKKLNFNYEMIFDCLKLGKK